MAPPPGGNTIDLSQYAWGHGGIGIGLGRYRHASRLYWARIIPCASRHACSTPVQFLGFVRNGRGWVCVQFHVGAHGYSNFSMGVRMRVVHSLQGSCKIQNDKVMGVSPGPCEGTTSLWRQNTIHMNLHPSRYTSIQTFTPAAPDGYD